MIMVVNKSTLVSNDDVKKMTRACAMQLRMHAAPLWGYRVVPVVYISNETDAPPGAWVVAILDDPNQADVLGWHTQNQGDLIYGRVFARPVLNNGGDALGKSLSVASVLSHEVLETYVDPHVNLWADRGDAVGVALEVADPVESDSYPVTIDGAAVTVSNFVTPHWFDPRSGPNDQLDYLRHTKSAFEIAPGGYVVVLQEGAISQQFGESYPEWRREMKQIDVARTNRRMNAE
jgi:hypothetical protein